MKHTLLCTTLLTLLSSSMVYAADPAQPATPATPKLASPAPAAAPTSIPAAETATPSTAAAAPQPEPVINCKYRIPAETNTIQQSIISTWAGKAAVQSFQFNPTTIDQELTDLKSCYTDPGWQGFNDALKKSGNIEAIKGQHLTVSSQVDGEVKINNLKDNQWKVNVPIQVVYQNDKEKLTQLLTIDLLIGRKVSGDLGIMQMIAAPRQTNTPAVQSPTTNPAPSQQQGVSPGSSSPALHH